MPTIIGWAGTDTLTGGAGDDFIVGGRGADRLTGGAGADRFRFNSWQDSRSDAPDTVTDFASGQDTIDLAGMTGLLLVRVLSVGSDTVLLAATSTGLMRVNIVGRVAPGDVRVPPGVPVEATTVNASRFDDSLVGTRSSDGRDFVTGTSGVEGLNGGDGSNPLPTFWDDILDGAGGADILSGGAWDIVYGGDGADVLSAGHTSTTGGTIYMVGGAGSDRFGAVTNVPVRILDFTTNGPDADVLELATGYRPVQFADGVQYGAWFVVGVTVNDMVGRVVGPAGFGVNPANYPVVVSGVTYAPTPTGITYQGATSADHLDYSLATGPLEFFADWSSGGTRSTVYSTRFDPVRGPVRNDETYDTLTGIEMITGTAFADTMLTEGRITLSGGGGDDRLIAYRFRGDSNVVLYGGAGDDQLVGNGEDRLYGDEGQDWIQGGDMNDLIYGGEGNDLLDPGTGSDLVDGGDGVDTVVYTGARSTYQITTANGVTRVTTTANGETDTLVGIKSIRFSDQTITLDPPVYVYSTAGEILQGTVAGDVLIGGGGADTIISGQGSDIIRYLATSDSQAGAARDTLSDFQTGQDRIDLTAIAPTSISVVLVAEGSSVRGVVFAETPTGAFQTYSPNVINSRDFIYNATFGVFVIGSSLADVIVGSTRADPLLGNGGDDTITGGGGADAIAGGSGRDRYVYLAASDSNGTAGLDNLYDFTSGEDTIDLRGLRPTSISIVRSENGSSFIFAEAASGSFLTTAAQRTVQGYDIDYAGTLGLYIQGSTVAETLIGSARRDELNGGAGDDVLIGGLGADGLFGGAGADIFRYEAPSHSTASETDIIRDFVSGVDVIDLLGVRTGIEDRFGIAQSGTSSFLFVDLGGDGTNDMVIALTNTTLRASDIVWGSGVGALGAEPSVKQPGPAVMPVENDGAVALGIADLSGHEARFMHDIEGLRGFHGQDWYL